MKMHGPKNKIKLERFWKKYIFRVIDLLSRNLLGGNQGKPRETSLIFLNTSLYYHPGNIHPFLLFLSQSLIVHLVSFFPFPFLILLSLYFPSINSFFTSVLTLVHPQRTSYFSISIIVPFHNFYIFVLLLCFRTNIFLLKSLQFFGAHVFHPRSSHVCILDG